VLNDLLDDVRYEIGLKRNIDLATTPTINTPVVAGLFRPVIYLPDEHINYSDLRFILMHEATHIKNGDMWCKLLSLTVMIVHWFNPVVYLMNRAIIIESELACDTAVLRRADEEQRLQYGETVFQAAKRSWQPEVKRYWQTGSMLASAFSDSGKILHRRLSAIIKHKNTKRWIAVCCALALSAGVITSGLVSCGSNEEDDGPEDDYVFVPEFTSLSALAHDIPNMRNITIAGNSVYFTSTSEISKDAFFRRTLIYTVDIDEQTLTYLPNYMTLPVPDGADAGGFIINDLKIDNDGNLWVAETGIFFTFDFPAGFDSDSAEIGELMDHAIHLDELFSLRKLDNTGSELLTIDTSYLIRSPEWEGVFSFNVDGDGNIFIGSFMHIFVLNPDGELLFYLPVNEPVFRGRLVLLSDGEMSFFGRWDPAQAPSINRIDVLNQSWGSRIDLPWEANYVFPGFDEFIAIINDGIGLSGIHFETDEVIQILGWAESGVIPASVRNVTLLPDNRIVFTNTSFESHGDGDVTPRTELIMLHRTPQDELPEIITITLLTQTRWLSPEIRNAIVEFNRTNSKYRVVTRDLGVNVNSRNDDFNRLAVEIITGGGPDIIDTGGLPFYQWAARGLFVDLYEFLDTDPLLSRDDILDVVLRIAETDGRLYRIFPDFSVWTMIGNANVVGSEPNWTFAEFAAQLEAHPQATTAFGVLFDGEGLFHNIFMSNIDDFINWETGRVYFDSEDFIELIEFAYRLQEVFSWWGPTRNEEEGTYTINFSSAILREMISSGELLVETWPVNDFMAPLVMQYFFGEDFIIKGYPRSHGSGTTMGSSFRFSISALSEHQEGAWEFLRFILSEDWQRENISFGFPVNKTIFEEILSRTKIGEIPANWAQHTILTRELPEEDISAYIDITLALIESIDGMYTTHDPLLDIIFEGLNDLFAGRITAQDAARIIQNRAAIYVAEQR